MIESIVHHLQRLGKAAYGGKWSADCDAELEEDRLALERDLARREALAVRSEKHLENLVAAERARIDGLERAVSEIAPRVERMVSTVETLAGISSRLETMVRELIERAAGADRVIVRQTDLISSVDARAIALEERVRTVERVRCGNLEARVSHLEPMVARVQALEADGRRLAALETSVRQILASLGSEPRP